MSEETVELSFWDRMAERAERWLKILPIFAGLLYVTGFLTTAARLASFEVPMMRLLDIQYFAAGVFPTLLVLLTTTVFYLAWKHHVSLSSLSWLGPDWAFLLLVFLLVAIPSLWGVAAGKSGRSPLDVSQLLVERTVKDGSIWFLLLAELLLWALLIAGRTLWARVRYIKTNWDDKGSMREAFIPFDWGCASLIVYSLAFVVFLIALRVIVPTIGTVYDSLPQTYGGGRPIHVEMQVDGQKMPSELLVVSATPGNMTKPLCLLLQTSDYYIVTQECTDGSRVWVVDSDNVFAVSRVP